MDQNVQLKNENANEIDRLHSHIENVNSQINSLRMQHDIARDELNTTQGYLDDAQEQSRNQIQHLQERNQLQKEAEILMIQQIKKSKCDFMTEQNRLLIKSGDITAGMQSEIQMLRKDLEFELIKSEDLKQEMNNLKKEKNEMIDKRVKNE